MARAKKQSTSPAPILDADYWAQFGLGADAATRDKLLWLALAEISRRGILDVNARWLCDLLEIDPSAINYHFGSFDGLIAEVFVQAHLIWEESIQAGLARPFTSPEQRLRNVLNAQVERAVRFGPVIGLSHLPHVSEQVAEELNARHPGALARSVSYAVGVATVLVDDLRTGANTPIGFTPQTTPIGGLVGYAVETVQAAIHIQWSVVGPTMWMTGSGGGVGELEQLPEPFRAAPIWPGFVDALVRSARG